MSRYHIIFLLCLLCLISFCQAKSLSRQFNRDSRSHRLRSLQATESSESEQDDDDDDDEEAPENAQPALAAVTRNGICTADERGILCFSAKTVEGCICTSPDTCNYTWVNHCIDCSRTDIYAVAENERCSPEDTRYLCPKADNLDTKTCSDNWVRGCLCYQNGTCSTTWVNECQSCNNSLVATVDLQKECPAQELSPSTCPVVPPATCSDETQLSCVCYTNGTCEERDVNNCTLCQETFVESVAVGRRCTGQLFDYWIPKQCGFSYSSVSCPSQTTSGCACYSNGTCKETTSNFCKSCSASNVVSFNELESCPNQTTGVHICTNTSTAQSRASCPSTNTTSCVCTSKNNCERRSVNSCTECKRTDIDVIVVFQDGACPASGIGSVSTAQNDPKAYICTVADRNNYRCPLYPSKLGCVCYTDGTCKNEGAQECLSCRDPTIVSVYEDGPCLDS